MTEREEKLYAQMLDKAKEAFIMAIEIYNKPTIHYRVEGFAFFICNAWELMLKAKIVKAQGEQAIYFPDKDNRTISLETCIKRLFTNENDPLRKNLEKIIELRNTCTHFITQEYEMLYVPLFQSCVYNFVEKSMQFHGMDITDDIPEHFIQLSVSLSPIAEASIRSKYSAPIANKLIDTKKSIEDCMEAEKNNRFAITIRHDYYLTKDKQDGTTTVRIVGKDEIFDEAMRIVKDVKDVSNAYPLTVKKIVEQVNSKLEKAGVAIQFNKNSFLDLSKYFNFKDNKEFCYAYDVNKVKQYSYSMRVVDFIITEIKKDNDICSFIHGELKQQKNS